jgi:hypothetical protein
LLTLETVFLQLRVDATLSNIHNLLAKNAADLDAEFQPYETTLAKVQHVGDLTVQFHNTATSSWAPAFNRGDLVAPRIDRADWTVGLVIPPIVGRVNVLSVADLLVVTQQLIGYEGGGRGVY